MKNFYEATVIRPRLELDISVSLKPVGSCYINFKFNEQEYFNGVLDSQQTINIRSGLNELLKFEITPRRQHPEAVIVEKITVNGHEIMPVYLHKSNPPTNYIDFNSTWSIEIPNFYQWYHNITGQGWIA